jgi:monoamine oxidase
MKTARIAIVGGGLSGLVAAYLLQQQGVSDVVLLEARARLGGRIFCASLARDLGPQAEAAALAQDAFDLGPAWFWPDHQPQLRQLVDHLGLSCHAQFEAGDAIVDRSPEHPPARARGYVNVPAAMRLVGGMAALVDALRSRLQGVRVITGLRVRQLLCSEAGVDVFCAADAGDGAHWRVQRVLLALPPRLAEAGLGFTPPLPPLLAAQWRATPTWMAPHAKYLAVYDTPFWREQGLSGQARSLCGPLSEIHDASVPGGSGALFGFFGVPAALRQRLPPDALRAHCRAQLGRLFGARALAPRADFLQDWATEPDTSTDADSTGAGHAEGAPAPAPSGGPWAGRLRGIASEWSPQYPGYLAGAVEAASLAVSD